MKFPQILKNLKEDRHCTNEEIARACGVSEGAVRAWIRGDKTPGSDKVILAAKFFGVSASQILGEREEQQKKPAATVGDGQSRVVTVIGRDGKAEKRVYSSDQYEAIQKLLDAIPYTVDDDL